MFNFIKSKLSKVYNSLTLKLDTLFAQSSIDEQSLQELEKLLLEADVGTKTTQKILINIRNSTTIKNLSGSDLKQLLFEELLSVLKKPTIDDAALYLLVGINGSGKTTYASKLAYELKNQGKKVLLVAADTFRAAAREQLKTWADQFAIDIFMGNENQDPSSVIFAAATKYRQEHYDVLIIDTAGRLQTKINLMHELAKMKKVLQRQLPDKKLMTVLTIDAMLGQNSFEQAKLFNECTTIDGIVLTKIDGTGKGGIIFAINQELSIPVVALSYGEHITDLKPFNSIIYVKELLDH